MNELGLFTRDNKILVSSRKVAEVYGKDHADVLKKIRGYITEIPELEHDGNFTFMFYNLDIGNGATRKSEEYLMDRQGFSILVNKFTGKKALHFTYNYSIAFENMAQQLTEQSKVPTLPMNYKEAIKQLLLQIEENESLQIENIDLKDRIGLLINKLSEVDARKAIDAIVKKYGGIKMKNKYGQAWLLFYRRLYIKGGIDLPRRKLIRNSKTAIECLDTSEEWNVAFNVAKDMFFEEIGTIDKLQGFLGSTLNIDFSNNADMTLEVAV